MNTILITGGAGAIGHNLVNQLIFKKKINKILILDDLSSGFFDLIPKSSKIEFYKGSVTDDKILKKLFENKIDYVSHLATLFANQNSVDHPVKDLNVNGFGTLKLLKFCKTQKLKRFIYASSSCVYGHQSNKSESFINFQVDTPYAITKILGEQYVNYFHEAYGIKSVIFRIFNSFGPGEKPGKYRNVIPNFFKKAISGEPLIIFGSGQETRDWNWVGNLVQAFQKALEVEEAIGETFNIGSGNEIKIIDLAKLINEITNNHSDHIFLPSRTWDKVKNRCANIEKAKNILKYNPDNKNFKEKLQHTYNWIKNL